jgi:hypothetical protein
LTLDFHIIRLRGLWQLKPLARYVERPGGYDRASADLPPSGKATMPADWSATCSQGFMGVVRFRRTFQKPTGLEPGDTVWLVVDPPRSRAAVVLAGQLLGEVRFSGPAGRFDITQLLEDRNTLEIEVEHPALDAAGRPLDDGNLAAPGGLVGEVRLEIQESGATSQEPGI